MQIFRGRKYGEAPKGPQREGKGHGFIVIIAPWKPDTGYGNPRTTVWAPDFIVESLINRTKSLPSPRDGDMVGLIDFSNAVTNLVSTMELLKSEAHVQNPEQRRRLVSKRPSALQLQWGEFAHKSNVDLKVFSKWLANRADAPQVVLPRNRAVVPMQEEARTKKSRPRRQPQRERLASPRKGRTWRRSCLKHKQGSVLPSYRRDSCAGTASSEDTGRFSAERLQDARSAPGSTTHCCTRLCRKSRRQEQAAHPLAQPVPLGVNRRRQTSEHTDARQQLPSTVYI